MFRLAAALGIAGALAAAAALGAAVASVHQSPGAGGRLDLAGLSFSYPTLNGPEWLLAAAGAIGAVTLTVALITCVSQLAAYRRFRSRLQVLGGLPGHPSVRVIDDAHPQAFCAGYLRPTVYISQAAIDVLPPAELAAVLAHEDHHRLLRDPLRFAGGRVLGRALFFLPALRSLANRYADEAELRADGAAVRASAGRTAPLAAALLVFDETAPSSAAGISPERVDSLLGEPPAWRLPWRSLSGSVGALSSVAVVLWQTSGAASARASLNLPLLSSRPCVVILTLLPVAACLAIALVRAGSVRPLRRLSGLR